MSHSWRGFGMSPATAADRKWLWTCALTLLLVSTLVRIASYPVQTRDFTDYYQHWFAALQDNSGLSAFRTPFANYAPLYLYLVKLLTFFPFSSLYALKTLSLVFDVALACVAAALVAAEGR